MGWGGMGVLKGLVAGGEEGTIGEWAARGIEQRADATYASGIRQTRRKKGSVHVCCVRCW